MGETRARRLKYIHEDVMRIFNNLPEREEMEMSMYDWETITRALSDIEVASNLDDVECLQWDMPV